MIRGDFGILENGMVWINQRTRYKALFFISEALVILLDRNRLVNNMHEVYKQPAFDDFGTVVSFPVPRRRPILNRR